jgi:adenylate kinase
MLREQKAAGTPAGLRAAEYFEKGLLVPDEITIEVVRQWLAGQNGAWALDGYPRTVRQAAAFDEMLRERGVAVDVALLIVADEPVIRDRVARRLVCQGCGAVFRVGMHVGQASEPCPKCDAKLGRRTDDGVEALADRLLEYHTKSKPVIAHYEGRGILRCVDGDRPPETVFGDICAVLEAARQNGTHGNPH